MTNDKLKFRAWDTKNLKWALVGFHLIGECTAFDLIGQYRLENLCDLELMQVTGCKDQDGNDIYEGDMLQERDSERKLIVSQHPTGLWVAKGQDGYVDYVLNICSKSKIVGNIYEQK